MRSKPSGGDSSIFEAHGEAQDIAADWIGDFHGRGGARQIAGIARIAEVVENRVVEHPRQYKAERPGLNIARRRAQPRKPVGPKMLATLRLFLESH